MPEEEDEAPRRPFTDGVLRVERDPLWLNQAIVAGSVVLILTGFARFPVRRADLLSQSPILSAVMLAAVAVFVPLTIASLNLWTDLNETTQARQVVADWLGDDTDLTVVALRAESDTVQVVLTGSGDPPSIDHLQSELDDALGVEVQLQVRLVPSTELMSSE